MVYKVANIIEESKLGGPQKRILLVASKIKKEIKTVVILPKNNSAELIELLKKEHISYKEMNLNNLNLKLRNLFNYVINFPLEIYQLANYFRKENFDLIHVSGGSWQYKGVLAGYLSSTKVVWHLNDTKSNFILLSLFYFYSKLCINYIFASKRSYFYYRNLLRKDIFFKIIQAPVDTKYFQKRKNSYNDNCKYVIGTICNPSPIKDLITFLKMAKEIKKIIKNAAFYIVGRHFPSQAKYLQTLNSLILDLELTDVKFIPSCSDVKEYLEIFDIYTCTSIAESSPLSVWEAMSMNLPIISTNVGDVPEFVRNNFNGYICDVGNYSSMAERIIQLFSNSNKRELFGARSREIAEKNLDLEITANLHIKHYIEVIENNFSNAY